MASRKLKQSEPKFEDTDLLWWCKAFVDGVYAAAHQEGREPPFAEVAVRQANALAERSSRAGSPKQAQSDQPPQGETKVDVNQLKTLRAIHKNERKVLRATYHYALDRWLDAIGLGPRRGRPPLSESYLAGILAIGKEQNKTALAKELGISYDGLRKQRRLPRGRHGR
jgi:hypothetical protein